MRLTDQFLSRLSPSVKHILRQSGRSRAETRGGDEGLSPELRRRRRATVTFVSRSLDRTRSTANSVSFSCKRTFVPVNPVSVYVLFLSPESARLSA